MALRRNASIVSALLAVLLPASAHASMFQGETLDKIADVVSWVVLIVVPVVAITVFWLVHILPEKIAEKKRHPQAQAIKTLCLLSLVFGGLLWPLAWIWAYTKPVLHKLAYGTDVGEHPHGDDVNLHGDEVRYIETGDAGPERQELEYLRKRVAELQARLQARSGTEEER
jgi:hypothetical protein